jgi:hypothetical protein
MPSITLFPYPMRKAYTWWDASGISARMRAMNAFASSTDFEGAIVAMKREFATVVSTRCTSAGTR